MVDVWCVPRDALSSCLRHAAKSHIGDPLQGSNSDHMTSDFFPVWGETWEGPYFNNRLGNAVEVLPTSNSQPGSCVTLGCQEALLRVMQNLGNISTVRSANSYAGFTR